MKLPTLLLTRSALGRQIFADLNSIEVGKSLSLVVFILVLLLNVYNDQSQYKLPKIKRSLTRNFGMTVQCDSQTVHASSYLNLCTFLLLFFLRYFMQWRHEYETNLRIVSRGYNIAKTFQQCVNRCSQTFLHGRNYDCRSRHSNDVHHDNFAIKSDLAACTVLNDFIEYRRIQKTEFFFFVFDVLMCMIQTTREFRLAWRRNSK